MRLKLQPYIRHHSLIILAFGVLSITIATAEENVETSFAGLTPDQLTTVKKVLTSVGGKECTKLFQINFEEYLICASRWTRLPKQDEGDGGEEEAGGFFQETLPNAVAPALALLTEGFTGINQVVNQSSGGTSQSLPNWIFAGVTNLFSGVSQVVGGVGAAVGIKPPAATPPPYFNLPPARPQGPSGTYPANSLSQGNRHQRPTLSPRGTITPRSRPRRRSTTWRPGGIRPASNVATTIPTQPPTSVQFKPFTIQYLGPNNGGESGNFFPAPTVVRPKPRPRRTTTSPVVVVKPQPTGSYGDVDIDGDPGDSETNSGSDSGFHSALLGSFGNQLKPGPISTTPTLIISGSDEYDDKDSIGRPGSTIFGTTASPYVPPKYVPVANKTPSNPTQISLWQAVALIKGNDKTPSRPQHSNNFVINPLPLPSYPVQSYPAPPYPAPSHPSASYLPSYPVTNPNPKPTTPEEDDEPFSHTLRPSPPPQKLRTTPPNPDYDLIPTFSPNKRFPSQFVTVSIIHPQLPAGPHAVIGPGSGMIASVSGNGSKQPVIVNNMYYPDLEAARLAAKPKPKPKPSTSTSGPPRKRRRRTTTTTTTTSTPTPSPTSDPDYYDEETTTVGNIYRLKRL